MRSVLLTIGIATLLAATPALPFGNMSAFCDSTAAVAAKYAEFRERGYSAKETWRIHLASEPANMPDALRRINKDILFLVYSSEWDPSEARAEVYALCMGGDFI